MAIRLSGMNSGLDTDSIVQALVSAYSTKTSKLTKTKTTMEWKKDAWKDLNTKIYNLYSKTLTSMKLSSAYNKKTTTCSDTTKATVTAGSGAINGSQSLQVEKLAKAGYLTGGKMTTTDGGKATASTTLAELGYTGIGDGAISLNVGGTTSNISVTADTKISDLVSQLNSAGVSASFDATNQRIFVSAKDSGTENDFSLTGGDLNGVKALSSLGLFVGSDANAEYYSELAAYENTDLESLLTTLKGLNDTNSNLQGENSRLTALKNSFNSYVEASQRIDNTINASPLAGDTTKIEKLKSYLSMSDDELAALSPADDTEFKQLKEASWMTPEQLATLKTDLDSVAAYEESYAAEYGDTTDLAAYVENVKNVVSTLGNTGLEVEDQEKLKNYLSMSDVQEAALTTEEKDEFEQLKLDSGLLPAELTALESNLTAIGDFASDFVADINGKISANTATITENNKDIAKESLILTEVGGINSITDGNITELAASLGSKIDFAVTAASANAYSEYYSEGAKRVDGQDAKIILNGAEFTSSSNTITVNGLTITALQETGEDETLSITTADDVQGVYDTIKNFLTEYNALVNEMDKLYNASTAKGYEPLTDEEKDAMTETEIEKWEEKIKESLLRRDSTLSSVKSVMTMSMAQSYTINGKSYSLTSFGINTLGYFASADNEKSAYHIDGDSEDAYTSGNTDKLLAALQDDPESVTSFFQQLTSDLYKNLDGKMKSIKDTKSIYNVYNDKKMDKDITNIQKQIDKWNDKLEYYEEFYYNKFAAMETALSKLQSSTSSLTAMLGG